MNNLYNSTDGTTRFIEDITNGGMTISKGTLCLWSSDIANKLIPETQNIEFNLSYILSYFCILFLKSKEWYHAKRKGFKFKFF